MIPPTSPEGLRVTGIGNGAFFEDSRLTSVTVPEGVTSIGNGAFYCCSRLTSVTIPEGVTSIGGSAFWYCPHLANISIPDSVASIGSEAFELCYGLAYNEYDNAYYLGNSTNPYVVIVEAKNTSITSCNIHSNTKVIAGSAFSGCLSLESVTIPDSVTSIGDRAFDGCSSLESITIPDSVTSIGSGAFWDCSSLTTIYYTGIEEDWTAIGGLSDANIPDGCEIIYNYVPTNE